MVNFWWFSSFGKDKLMLNCLKSNRCKDDIPIRFITKRTKCLHRLMAVDIPPGLDSDDVVLSCEEDPKCPEIKNLNEG